MTTEADREKLRAQLRTQAPDLAAFADSLREQFGPVRMTYFKAGDIELGKPVDPSRLVSSTNMVTKEPTPKPTIGRGRK